jgi:hypothetical protein
MYCLDITETDIIKIPVMSFNATRNELLYIDSIATFCFLITYLEKDR